jgi:biopolymer transport protein ExbD
MAFKKLSNENRRLPLVSLIDLIFILLIFFIVTSTMIRLTRGESRLHIPTPKNEPGEAQILIQIIDENNYLWLDHTAIDTLYRHNRLLRKPADARAKVDLLLEKMTLNTEALMLRLDNLQESLSNGLKKEYFVLIRCPEALPYFYATHIVERLVHNPYVEFGCVAGELEDIRSSKNLFIEGNVLQIDFARE